MRARALAFSLVVLVWSVPLPGRAEGGAICSVVEGEAQPAPENAPGADVYVRAGTKWLTDALRERYPRPPDAPATAEGLRPLLQGVKQAVGASTVFASAGGKRIQERLLKELATIDEVLAELDQQKPIKLAQLKEYALTRLQQTSDVEVCTDTQKYTTDSLFFRGAEPVVLQASSQVIAGEPDLQIEASAQDFNFVTIAEASEFRAALESVSWLLNAPLRKAVDRTSRRLTEIDRSWSNYLEHGFSQYPWESWINSWGTLSWDKAPWSQWIFFHPELAVAVDARHLKHASGSAALLVHGLGFLGYGETRSWFFGASVTGAVTTNREWGFGGGGTLHFGHTQLYSRVPHISLAVLVFANETGKLGPYFALSADFWRLVSDSGEQLFKNKLSE